MTKNLGFEYRETLGPDADGERLLEYLSRRYRHSSPLEWEERIADGRVLLDERPATPGAVIRGGQVLVWKRPPWREPEAPTSFAILYEDEDLLAVAKPAGLPTLPGAGYLRATLLHLVREHDPEAAPLHRLGRWTSGVVLFARSGLARTVLTRAWTAREIGKRYRALAAGAPSRESFVVDSPIGPVPHPLLGSIHAASPEGKRSRTHVDWLEDRGKAFLCDARIESGRPHQIRIHLAAAGHPLVGDPLFVRGGLPAPGSRALPGDPGYHLHAAELTFRHPRDGHDLVIRCAPPPLLRRSGS